MNIAVIAANGQSGQAFVKTALAAGHVLRAGVRSTTNALPDHPRLTIVMCDATVLSDVRTLIAGQDAVVSLLGHVRHSPKHVQSDAIRNALAAMDELGIRRLISLTGSGVRVQNDEISSIDRLLNFGVRRLIPAQIQDGIDHYKILEQSSLDWTVIRALILQNSPPQPYELRLHGPSKVLVSRGEVAQAILEVLEAGSFIRQAPILGKA